MVYAMNERMIAYPCETDPYERQQLLEMRFCERCKWQLGCRVYGRPHDEKCMDRQEFENRKGCEK